MFTFLSGFNRYIRSCSLVDLKPPIATNSSFATKPESSAGEFWITRLIKTLPLLVTSSNPEYAFVEFMGTNSSPTNFNADSNGNEFGLSSQSMRLTDRGKLIFSIKLMMEEF